MYNQVTYETYLKTFINTQNHAQQCQDSLPSLDHSSTVSCLVFTMFYRVLSLRNFTSEWSVLVHMCALWLLSFLFWGFALSTYKYVLYVINLLSCAALTFPYTVKSNTNYLLGYDVHVSIKCKKDIKSFPNAAWPVTEVVHCAEAVAGAGQAATGAVSEISFLTVLTLQTCVAWQTGTLTCDQVTLLWFHNPFTTSAAVTEALWIDGQTCQDKKVKDVKYSTRCTVSGLNNTWFFILFVL